MLYEIYTTIAVILFTTANMIYSIRASRKTDATAKRMEDLTIVLGQFTMSIQDMLGKSTSTLDKITVDETANA